MTYNELVAAVSDYCENTFPTVDMNTFIRQAEQRIYNTVQLASLRKNVTGVVSPATPYLSAPSDFLSAYSLAVIDSDGNYDFLLNKDVNFIREAYPKVSDTGVPKHYAIFGPTVSGSTITNELSFMMGPKPNSAYTVELHYYYYPESIVDSQTSWLGDNFDSALLYGTICEAFVYMRQEADMMKVVQDRYVQAMALLKNLGDGKQRMDAYRDGQVRVQVN